MRPLFSEAMATEEDMTVKNGHHHTFRVGARIRLNELGKSRSRVRVETGELVKLPKPGSGGRTVEVLFDGNKLTTRVHRSYIELDC